MGLRIVDIPRDPPVDRRWDLDDERLATLPPAGDFAGRVNALRERARALARYPAAALLGFFDSLAETWLDRDTAFLRALAGHGVGYLLDFLRRDRLEPMLRASLRGDPAHLDGFIDCPHTGHAIMCHPRGVIAHWLSGNVPTLGAISLVQGLITRNANVVKLSRTAGLVLPVLASRIAAHVAPAERGGLSGRELMAAVMFVYAARDDAAAHALISEHADVRVAWGGAEAVATVQALPRRPGGEDVIFGPKYSFAVIGRDAFASDRDLESAMQRLARDVSLFDQHGCNSPHTVLVERGGPHGSLDVARALAAAMTSMSKRIPKAPVTADEACGILEARADYELDGDVFSSPGTEWTVIHSDEQGLARPRFSRVVFVRPVEDIDGVLAWIGPGHQTLGLALGAERRAWFTREATARGIDRITALGEMSSYSHPWDGLFPLQRFVRWVSAS